MTKYEVLTDTLCQGWVNCWTIVEDKPMTFDTIQSAQEEIDTHIKDIEESIAYGFMSEDSKVTHDDFKIGEVTP
jgi:hypothetical protein